VVVKFPKVLETILKSDRAKFIDPNLLVGNETSDDAAVYDLATGRRSSAPPTFLCR
jgi:selenophosphate synthase